MKRVLGYLDHDLRKGRPGQLEELPPSLRLQLTIATHRKLYTDVPIFCHIGTDVALWVGAPSGSARRIWAMLQLMARCGALQTQVL